MNDIRKKELLTLAYVTARRSLDESVQNGAVLVHNGSDIICTGTNNFPPNVERTHERLARPAKYLYTEHAERAAIYRAARFGVSIEGAILVCPWFACADCARAIVLAGISHVIGHKQIAERSHDSFSWQEAIKHGYAILDEGGVTYELVDCVLDLPFELRFDGKLWRP